MDVSTGSWTISGVTLISASAALVGSMFSSVAWEGGNLWLVKSKPKRNVGLSLF
jgi:hypothetical protein